MTKPKRNSKRIIIKPAHTREARGIRKASTPGPRTEHSRAMLKNRGRKTRNKKSPNKDFKIHLQHRIHLLKTQNHSLIKPKIHNMESSNQDSDL
jgi:hypothetical protein